MSLTLLFTDAPAAGGGAVMLDADGNVILQDDGDVLLDDGAGNDCCCGPATLSQWRKCSDNTLSNLWSAPEPTVPAYMRYRADGLCYYKDGTEPLGTPDESGIEVVASVPPNYDFGDYDGIPNGEDCTSAFCDPAPCVGCTGDTPGAIIAVVEDVVPNNLCIDSITHGCGGFGSAQFDFDPNGTYLMLYAGECDWICNIGTATIRSYASPDCADLISEDTVTVQLYLNNTNELIIDVLGAGNIRWFINTSTLAVPRNCMTPAVVSNALSTSPPCISPDVYRLGTGGTITLTPVAPLP